MADALVTAGFWAGLRRSHGSGWLTRLLPQGFGLGFAGLINPGARRKNVIDVSLDKMWATPTTAVKKGRRKNRSRQNQVEKKSPRQIWTIQYSWRPRSESNRRTRLCRPLHDHSATRPVALCIRYYYVRAPRCANSVFWHRKNWSGKRDSNSRPRPWQGRALPTELFPLRGREL
jgi:hypothetical protein